MEGGHGGDPYVNHSSRRSGTHRSSSDDRPQQDVRISEVGGVGGYSVAIAVIALLIVLGVFVVGALW